MLSQKMLELGTNRSVIRDLFEYAKERKAQIGEDKVFDFSIGNPSVPAPPCVQQAVEELIREGDPVLLHGYTSAQGDAGLRQAIADYVNGQHGTALTADNFYITVGAAASLSITLKALAEEGDEFITFAPFFPEYRVFVENTGSRLVVVNSDPKDFQIDQRAFEAAVTDHTKGVILNSPNNPSGVAYSAATLRKLADLLREKSAEYGHTIYLISDEPYREIVFSGVEAPCVSAFYDDTIMCYSFSKSLSIPGERIGYVAVNPRCRDAETMVNMCGQISRGTGHNCPPSIIQFAVAKVLDKTADLSVYETNMEILYKELVDLGFTCVKPGGTFYIFPKALEEDAKAFCRKALAYDLVLVPGDTFGAPGYFRMAYCIATEKVERSLKALRRFVEETYR